MNLQALERRVRSMVRRGVLSVLSDEGAQRATVEGVEPTPLDLVEVIEPYGFTSRPTAGAEVITIAVGGAAEHQVCLHYDRRSRPKGLEAGEVAVYHAGGASVVLKANGDVVITPGAAGVVKIGGDAAENVLALHAELKDILADLLTILGALSSAWGGLPLVAWPADGATLKLVWTGTIAPMLVTLSAKMAAALGSAKGRG